LNEGQVELFVVEPFARRLALEGAWIILAFRNKFDDAVCTFLAVSSTVEVMTGSQKFVLANEKARALGH
jgi:hypothetical protein